MSDEINHEHIQRMLELPMGEVKDLDADRYQVKAAEIYSRMIGEIDLLYDLLLLEGRIRHEQFHQEKKDLIASNIRYGNITSQVVRSNGTNVYRFMFRKKMRQPNRLNREFTNESIKMGQHGYSKRHFAKAVSDEELMLCMSTEGHYARLREQGLTLTKIKRWFEGFTDLNRLYGYARREDNRIKRLAKQRDADMENGNL